MTQDKEYENVWVRKGTKLRLKTLASQLKYPTLVDFLEDVSKTPHRKLAIPLTK